MGSLQNSENEFRELTGRPPGTLAVARLSSKDYFDLTIDADLGDTWFITLSVENLFDEDPPFVGGGSVQDANTDPLTYDILGRRYFLRIGASM